MAAGSQCSRGANHQSRAHPARRHPARQWEGPFAGGDSTSGSQTACDLYDPVTNTAAPTGSLATGRSYPLATLLANGKVLLSGGANGSGTLSSAELYDPATGLWSRTGSMLVVRAFHAEVLLPNGKVLVAGGDE